MTGGQGWGPPSTTPPPPQHVPDAVRYDGPPEQRDRPSDVPAYFTPRRPTPPPVSSGPSRRIRPTHPRSTGARAGSGSGSRTDPAVLVSALVMIALAVAVMVGLLTS
ncbi:MULTISPECIES: hypothetical protein [Gordonia]|uniref:Uncharacterized protein n=1 Tax=Gordonia alkanivorans NBRC 16433 TaxID=1027371 RepID=F9W208_9ACTN|nr:MULTISPECIES: hypothetical protein [Gordonia]MDH3008330.1 hypothetical protein [Gordonia alkanivorans]MDH3017280.1 hypothetical protein [Gordonia alkanivorans]MDH3021827.1 hypothetical protein [Gordonia alkanivorans]MDH3025162.1 hypothetical protein [Gordonia alkanivorans]MDH3042521.1 hypothetical protein [Gordonia alkanivorans]